MSDAHGPKGSAPHPPAAFGVLAATMAVSLPGMLLHLFGSHGDRSPFLGLLVFGGAIVAAAFVLTWGAELAQLDIGSGLAIVFVALVTVLPEYAVDMLLAWQAAIDPGHQNLALANMTGANRMLIGVGWPIVALIVWYKRGQRSVDLGKDRAPDVFWLLVATLYSAAIPLKNSLAWYDAVVLIGFYALYVMRSKNEPGGTHDLVGPPQAMARWAPSRRKKATAVLFLWAGTAIFLCAHPFVESLQASGAALGIAPTFFIQWLAPLASEAPEFVVVVLLTLRGRADMGLGAFVSSKVNQWTLLVGGVPLAFGLSSYVHDLGFKPAMILTAWQKEELWLTITQGLYAVATILDLNFSLRQALAILVLFLVQFVGSIALEATGMHAAITPFHTTLSILYAILALERFVAQRHELKLRLAEVFGRAS
jgi:cation:H+ antiporter